VWSEGAITAEGENLADDFVDWAWETIELYAPWDLRVTCEKFDVTQRTMGKGADAHWAIGQSYVLAFACRRFGAEFVLPQPKPAEAKSFSTDAKLRAMGWYTPTRGGHVNDAKRHLLLYLVKAGLADLRLLSQ
jgi:hypothetical protein